MPAISAGESRKGATITISPVVASCLYSGADALELAADDVHTQRIALGVDVDGVGVIEGLYHPVDRPLAQRLLVNALWSTKSSRMTS